MVFRKLISKSQLRIIEKYVFLGQLRYRVQVVGTNIVFNVSAESDDEALEKALELARKVGLTKEVIEEIRKRIRSRQ